MSLERIQAKVDKADYDYVFGTLGGHEHGLQQHITSRLFTHFANYLRTINLTPYAYRNRTAQQLRNLSDLVTIVSRD